MRLHILVYEAPSRLVVEGDHREKFEWTSVEEDLVQALNEPLQAPATRNASPSGSRVPPGDSVSGDDPRARASARPGVAPTSSAG